MKQNEHVVLVDRTGKVLGTEEKIAAHKKGLLHLAFSIFIFNSSGKMLLQQRALSKYHFGGLWSNTCCSHPHLNESTLDAAHRRLKEELGFDTPLYEAFSFIYNAYDEQSQLTEHELDTVFIGIYDNPEISFNKNEIQNIQWVSIFELFILIEDNAEQFSYWFKIALTELKNRHLLSISNILRKFEIN